MGASRKSRLLLSGAVCGALILGTAESTATADTVPSVARADGRAAPAPAPAHAVTPSPEALRKAAAEGAKAIDDNAISHQARQALAACGSAHGANETRNRQCATLTEHLDMLGKARSGLAKEAAAPRPDLNAITTATTDAVAATARLAKDQAPPDNTRSSRARDGSGGLLSVASGLVGGLVGALGGVVSGLEGLVSGLLRALLG